MRRCHESAQSEVYISNYVRVWILSYYIDRHKDCICVNDYEGPHCEYKSGTTPTFIANAKSAAFQSSNSLMSDTVLYSAMAGICVLIGFLMLSFIVRSRRKRAHEMKELNEVKKATEDLAMVQVNMYDDDSSSGKRNGFV